MKRIKEKVTIKELRVLGSYGKMYHDTEVYPHSLRKLSKDVKKNDTTAIAIAALLLSQILIPQRSVDTCSAVFRQSGLYS